MTRDATAIGAGLAPAREARAIRRGERIHVVGIAGAGASAAALLSHWAGAVVTGCDKGGPSPYTVALEAVGIPMAWSHDVAHVTTVPTPGRLAVTKALTAIDPDHPELGAARERDIPVEPWQQVVADVAHGRTLVAVAGTHGKSTTAGWLVYTLTDAGLDPGAFVGALLPGDVTGGVPATARWGKGAPFVVEADEYAGNFDAYRPDVIVLTSLEWDHPDVFADREAVSATFERWIGAATSDDRWPVLIANVGDAGVADLCDRLRVDQRVNLVVTAVVDVASSALEATARALAATYADRVEPAGVLIARIVDARPDGTAIEFASQDETYVTRRTPATLPTAGRHNVANALGVFTAARTLGLATDAAIRAIESFPGVGRRLERKGESSSVVVYDDYGHHPTAILATIKAVRQREPGRRVWAVYEPLTYHRTAALRSAFAEALATADGVVIADIWAGRDSDTTIATADGLAGAVSAVRGDLQVAAPGSVEATAEWLARHVRAGDVVLIMGGGRSYVIGEELLRRLEAT